MTRKEQLKADLLQNFSDFQKIDPNVAPGGSDAANSIVASGLAESIDRAIDEGVEFSFQGIFTVNEINSFQEKQPGYLYTCSDNGVLIAKTELPVVKNTVVLWNGEAFETFLVIPDSTGLLRITIDKSLSTRSRNPVENKVITSAINAMNADIAEHLRQEAEARAGADADIAERLRQESEARAGADDEIIEDLSDETSARRLNDELLQDQIEQLAQHRTDWDEDDPTSLSYLMNHPIAISDTEIEAIFA